MTRHYNCWAGLLQVAAVAMTLLWASSATAREDEIEAAPAPPPPAAGKFDMAFGVAGTTDYASRGITLDDSSPAIQGYVEPSYGLGPVLGDAFVNIWSSNVDFGDDFQGAEIDIAGGIKPKFLGPNWSPNIGYVHYFYAPEHVSPDYGRSTLRRTMSWARMLSIPFKGLYFLLLTSTKPAKPPLGSRGAGRWPFGKISRRTPAWDISFSKTRMRSSSWPGLQGSPTTGSH
jgi:hypothetical protein